MPAPCARRGGRWLGWRSLGWLELLDRRWENVFVRFAQRQQPRAGDALAPPVADRLGRHANGLGQRGIAAQGLDDLRGLSGRTAKSVLEVFHWNIVSANLKSLYMNFLLGVFPWWCKFVEKVFTITSSTTQQRKPCLTSNLDLWKTQHNGAKHGAWLSVSVHLRMMPKLQPPWRSGPCATCAQATKNRHETHHCPHQQPCCHGRLVRGRPGHRWHGCLRVEAMTCPPPTMPSKRVTDARFAYTKAVATDIRKTFAKARAKITRDKAKEASEATDNKTLPLAFPDD